MERAHVEADKNGGANTSGRRGRGELESEVLATLWATQEPLTPAQVQQSLSSSLAYNTVQTILIRLLDKGLVVRESLGRAHCYRPTRGQAELAAEQMHALLGQGPDHAAVLQRFLGTLGRTDEAVLRQLLGAPPPPAVSPPGP